MLPVGACARGQHAHPCCLLPMAWPPVSKLGCMALLAIALQGHPLVPTCPYLACCRQHSFDDCQGCVIRPASKYKRELRQTARRRMWKCGCRGCGTDTCACRCPRGLKANDSFEMRAIVSLMSESHTLV